MHAHPAPQRCRVAIIRPSSEPAGSIIATRHPDLLSVERSALLVVDVQEQFRAHIHDVDEMIAAVCLLLRGCGVLGIPVVVSEQYPKGLGPTMREIEQAIADASLAPERMEKLDISSCAAPAWSSIADTLGERDTLLVVGIETHVCVMQTVLDALARGLRVHVIADAVGSRDPWQREMALDRMARAGATVSTVEMALFELLECAGTPQFKAVQHLIKAYDASRSELGVGA